MQAEERASVYMLNAGVADSSDGRHETGCFATIVQVCVGFEVLLVVVMNVTIFWNVAPSGSYVKRLFGGTYRRHLQGRESAEIQPVNIQKQDFSSVKLEVIRSSETSIHILATALYSRR
jgi:hypothetical protein